jgi:hypothetical protein
MRSSSCQGHLFLFFRLSRLSLFLSLSKCNLSVLPVCPGSNCYLPFFKFTLDVLLGYSGCKCLLPISGSMIFIESFSNSMIFTIFGSTFINFYTYTWNYLYSSSFKITCKVNTPIFTITQSITSQVYRI